MIDKIAINLGGKRRYVTMKQAKKLYEDLHELFGEKQSWPVLPSTPTPYPVPIQPYDGPICPSAPWIGDSPQWFGTTTGNIDCKLPAGIGGTLMRATAEDADMFENLEPMRELKIN